MGELPEQPNPKAFLQSAKSFKTLWQSGIFAKSHTACWHSKTYISLLASSSPVFGQRALGASCFHSVTEKSVSSFLK
jgi:hypothetical protein